MEIVRSDDVVIHFPLVKFENAMEYLKGVSGPMALVIREFSKLKNEQEIVNFKYPSWVSETIDEYNSGMYSKDSDGFRNFNTAITAINLIKVCAKYNLAILALQDKYKAVEATLYYSRFSRPPLSYGTPNWHLSADEDVLRIKNAAIAVRDKIHAYSKKYTLQGFEEDFINTFKYAVYSTCNRFRVNTKTVTEEVVDTGGNFICNILFFICFCVLFWLVAKCACS